MTRICNTSDVIIIIDEIRYAGVSSPPDVAFFLDRPHINKLLEDAIQKPLTIVMAGAGHGKTQAVSALLTASDSNVLWFQLSRLDNLVERLWERFVYGFKLCCPKLASAMNALGYPKTIAAFNRFLYLLAKEITNNNNRRFIFVLDDFHTIYDNAVLGFVKDLLDARIQNLSIVLISRIKPSFNLPGMASKGMLTIISEEALRFSKDEISAYYAMQGLTLNEDIISNIHAYTGGWIFAIYLIGLSMKKGGVDARNPIALARDDLFELIEREIFSTATDRVQELLITLSLLDVAPKGLLKELSGDDSVIQTELMNIGPFFRYDSFSDSFRMHQLFQHFLLEKKNWLSEEQIRQVYLTAAKWYEANDGWSEAISCYQMAGCYPEIFDILLSMGRRVAQETADLFIRLIEEAPEAALQAKPIMHVVKAYYLLNNNRIDVAYDVLCSLRKQYECLPPTIANLAILGEAYIALALISIINQNLEFESLFYKAEVCLPGGSALVDSRLNIAEGINITGIKNPIAGELTSKYEAVFRAMPSASRVMNGCCYGAEFLNAADSCFMTGDIRGAEKYAYEAIYHARQKQQHGIECMANFILVRIYMQKGNYARVITILDQMKSQLNGLGDSIPLYDIIRGWYYVKIGETDKVPSWILCEEETKKQLPPVVVGREYLVRSDSLLAQGRYEELLAFMKQTDVLYKQRGILYAVIQNKITEAIIYHYIGDSEASIDALNEAYRLSSPNNLVIQYIEYGNQMRTVLYAAKRNVRCLIPVNWLDKISTKSSYYAKQISSVVAEYNEQHGGPNENPIKLSARENEILNYLCQGLTRKEIAVSCDLSMNTVKSIVQSLYAKLGAINSADAVRIAGTMGFIKE